MYSLAVCRNLLFILSPFSPVKPEQVYLNLSSVCVFKVSLQFCVVAFGLLPVVLCHLEMCFSKHIEVFVMLSRVKSFFCLLCTAVTFHRFFSALRLPNSWFLLHICVVDYLQWKFCFCTQFNSTLSDAFKPFLIFFRSNLVLWFTKYLQFL